MGVTFAGISYNKSKVKPEQAPKTWKDMLNPIHKDGMSAKLATSGMQHMQWYMLRKLYGADYWQEFAKLRPRGFDSRAQLFDRLARATTASAGWRSTRATPLQGKGRGDRVLWRRRTGCRRRRPSSGWPNKAPHPEAAKLFVDWALVQPGPGGEPDADHPPLRLGEERRTADGDRQEAVRLQVALPHRLGGLPGQPFRLREGVERA